MNAIYKSRKHFRKSLRWRFKIPPNVSQKLERVLMQDLFMGKLRILEEEDRGLKIYFPAIHEKCILIFSKQLNVFVTSYPAGKGRILNMINKT